MSAWDRILPRRRHCRVSSATIHLSRPAASCRPAARRWPPDGPALAALACRQGLDMLPQSERGCQRAPKRRRCAVLHRGHCGHAGWRAATFCARQCLRRSRVDVDIPYAAEADKRRPCATSCALVMHPCEDLRPVNEVGVRREWDGGERLAWACGSVCEPWLTLAWWVVDVEVGHSAAGRVHTGDNIVAVDTCVEAAHDASFTRDSHSPRMRWKSQASQGWKQSWRAAGCPAWPLLGSTHVIFSNSR